jgi:hypothetical protein
MLTKLVYVCSSLLLAPAFAEAQALSRTFVEVSGGVATQAPLLSVRSGVGATAALAVGRQLSEPLTLEARLSASVFGAPERFVSPGGCLGVSPCTLPAPSTVRVVTLGASGEYSFATTPVRPLALIGLGGRYVSEAPERGSDTRPYGELVWD